MNDVNDEKLTIVNDVEFERIYACIKKDITENRNSVSSPVGVVLGGQPGSGKRNIYEIFDEKYSDNVVRVDCDEFRRYHPHFLDLKDKYGENDEYYTQPFVRKVLRRIVPELSNEHYNFVFESTLKNPDVSISIKETIAPKGYSAILCVMATSKEASWQGVVDRYKEQVAKGKPARMVPKEYHDLVVSNICDSLDVVYKSGQMSNILIYNRQKECLYDMSKTPELNPTNILYEQIHGREKIKSFSLKEENKGLCMKETQSDREKFQMREASPFMKSNCKIKNDIER